jgi:hypothetical protein
MRDGAVEYVVKFAVTLSSNMELRSFPFDTQDLPSTFIPLPATPNESCSRSIRSPPEFRRRLTPRCRYGIPAE